MASQLTQRFRRIWQFLTPGWRQGGDGGPELFSLTLMIDAFVQRIRSGLESRMPSRASESATALIAGDRGLLRGRSESAEDFAARLIAWRTPRTHRVRGNAYEAIKQISHYWGLGTIASTIDAHGVRHLIDEFGSSTRSVLSGWTTLKDTDPADSINEPHTNWDDANADTHWSRFWVTIQHPASLGVLPQPDLGDSDLWGGALGTPGYTLGQQGVTPADVLAMRQLFQDLNWHPGNTVPEWLILVFDGEVLASPVDGDDWTHWSVNNAGNQEPVRDTSQRYWALNPESNRYSGDATSFAETSDDVEGNTAGYGPGDETFFPFTTTLPDGQTYGGDVSAFSTNIQLVDDGSIPA